MLHPPGLSSCQSCRHRRQRDSSQLAGCRVPHNELIEAVDLPEIVLGWMKPITSAVADGRADHILQQKELHELVESLQRLAEGGLGLGLGLGLGAPHSLHATLQELRALTETPSSEVDDVDVHLLRLRVAALKLRLVANKPMLIAALRGMQEQYRFVLLHALVAEVLRGHAKNPLGPQLLGRLLLLVPSKLHSTLLQVLNYATAGPAERAGMTEEAVTWGDLQQLLGELMEQLEASDPAMHAILLELLGASCGSDTAAVAPVVGRLWQAGVARAMPWLLQNVELPSPLTELLLLVDEVIKVSNFDEGAARG